MYLTEPHLNHTENIFDLIIVGGGMVGATFAVALAKSRLRILLIDAAPMTKPLGDGRYIALNDASVCLFKNIGIWSRLTEQATPIKQVHVSQRHRFGRVKITAEECEVVALGQVVPAQIIQAELYAELAIAQHIQLLQPARAEALSEDEPYMTLQVSTDAGPMKLKACFIAVADGTHSSMRQLLNMTIKQVDYQQSALVTKTELHRHHHQVAYERFLVKGAIAMLPLQEHFAATIWTDSHATIQTLMALPDKEFLALLQEQMGHRLGRFKAIGHRNQYPLQRTQIKSKTHKRVLFLGNAAHTQHPIAAQGLNLALYEIAVLVENLLKPVPQFELTSGALFRQQCFSQQLSHHLQGLFAQDFFIFNLARQMGMFAFDSCLLTKKHFAQAAMGRAGYVPWLMMRNER